MGHFLALHQRGEPDEPPVRVGVVDVPRLLQVRADVGHCAGHDLERRVRRVLKLIRVLSLRHALGFEFSHVDRMTTVYHQVADDGGLVQSGEADVPSPFSRIRAMLYRRWTVEDELVLAARRWLAALDTRSNNSITRVDENGVVTAETSLYDVLRSEPALRTLVDRTVSQRAAECRMAVDAEHIPGDRLWWTLRRLRSLPGSPCDVLHTNTLEVLDDHPSGLWKPATFWSACANSTRWPWSIRCGTACGGRGAQRSCPGRISLP